MTREATAAHPLCICREHIHGIDRCTALWYLGDPPGPAECRILGGVPADVRAACQIHGKAATT